MHRLCPRKGIPTQKRENPGDGLLMPIYEFCCDDCGRGFEKKRPMAEYYRMATCPECGQWASRVPSVVNHTFGWRLDEQSHSVGAEDQLERNI